MVSCCCNNFISVIFPRYKAYSTEHSDGPNYFCYASMTITKCAHIWSDDWVIARNLASREAYDSPNSRFITLETTPKYVTCYTPPTPSRLCQLAGDLHFGFQWVLVPPENHKGLAFILTLLMATISLKMLYKIR